MTKKTAILFRCIVIIQLSVLGHNCFLIYFAAFPTQNTENEYKPLVISEFIPNFAPQTIH